MIKTQRPPAVGSGARNQEKRARPLSTKDARSRDRRPSPDKKGNITCTWSSSRSSDVRRPVDGGCPKVRGKLDKTVRSGHRGQRSIRPSCPSGSSSRTARSGRQGEQDDRKPGELLIQRATGRARSAPVIRTASSPRRRLLALPPPRPPMRSRCPVRPSGGPDVSDAPPAEVDPKARRPPAYQGRARGAQQAADCPAERGPQKACPPFDKLVWPPRRAGLPPATGPWLMDFHPPLGLDFMAYDLEVVPSADLTLIGWRA